ncbi:carboxymuconolactone decarboxylase family protein [Mycobacterium sp. NPDC003449]
MSQTSTESLLDTIRGERGYTLSYHEIYARTEPDFLARYADLYRAFTLDQRILSPRERELVWIGILVADGERVGTLHLERALEAGITPDEVGDAVAVAAVAHGWPALAFVDDAWTHAVEFSMWTRYAALLKRSAPLLSAREIELVATATQGALQHGAALLWHLERLYAAGTPEAEIGEVISYLLLPKGANTMLWATDLWLGAIADGRLTAGETLAGVNTATRRS